MSKTKRSPGQVVVEMLLILPVFLTIVFTIMEMGYIAFNMILLNHATYEVARIGAMTRTRASDGNVRQDCGDLMPLMQRVILTARVVCRAENTLNDDQAQQMNQDLIVTGSYQVKLVFPISSLLLSVPHGSGYRPIAATVRMPIEQPLKY